MKQIFNFHEFLYENVVNKTNDDILIYDAIDYYFNNPEMPTFKELLQDVQIYKEDMTQEKLDEYINSYKQLLNDIISGKIENKVTFSKGYGYWDVTKYPYGGDFKSFVGGESGKIVAGTTKYAYETRVLLDDGRTIVVKNDAITNMYNFMVKALNKKIGVEPVK
jgi:hypothetical protein